jgi:hypothetical protein
MDSRVRRVPSALVTSTVSRLAATVRSTSMSQELMPCWLKKARLTTLTAADRSRTALGAEIPARRAVLFQLVSGIS